MSAGHLREAERRFRVSGSVEDECELLRARLRLGLLRRERLAVAAYAGHPAARFLLGTDAPEPFTTAGLLDVWQHDAWTEVARQIGQATSVATAEAALRVVFSGRTRAWLSPFQLGVLRAHLEFARGTLGRAERLPVPRRDIHELYRVFRRGPAWHCGRAAADLVEAALNARSYPRHTGDALRAAGSAAVSLGMADPAQVDAAARAVLVEHALGAVEAAAGPGPR